MAEIGPQIRGSKVQGKLEKTDGGSRGLEGEGHGCAERLGVGWLMN